MVEKPCACGLSWVLDVVRLMSEFDKSVENYEDIGDGSKASFLFWNNADKEGNLNEGHHVENASGWLGGSPMMPAFLW